MPRFQAVVFDSLRGLDGEIVIAQWSDGRFFGRRVNCEQVPLLPAWAVAQVFDDPKEARRLLVWKDSSGAVQERVHIHPFDEIPMKPMLAMWGLDIAPHNSTGGGTHQKQPWKCYLGQVCLAHLLALRQIPTARTTKNVLALSSDTETISGTWPVRCHLHMWNSKGN